MVRPVTPNRSRPITEADSTPAQHVHDWMISVTTAKPLIGTGSPEDVVEADQAEFYMDSNGTTGSILYIKKFDEIGGDRKKGWILV